MICSRFEKPQTIWGRTSAQLCVETKRWYLKALNNPLATVNFLLTTAEKIENFSVSWDK